MVQHNTPRNLEDRRERRARDKAETLRRRQMRAMKYGTMAAGR